MCCINSIVWKWLAGVYYLGNIWALHNAKYVFLRRLKALGQYIDLLIQRIVLNTSFMSECIK